MTRDDLVNKLEAVIDDAFRQKLYGDIHIEFRAGKPMFLNVNKQEKLDTENRSYGKDR
jgi:hypothetical protein